MENAYVIRMKTCPRCKQEKPAEAFSIDRNKKSGFSSYCVPCNADRRREWYANNKEKARAINRVKSTEWLGEKFDKPLSRNGAANRVIRAKVLATYGGKCACCGDDHQEFLTIDHIDGGGKQHRDSTKGYFYRQIMREGCPDKYRVLCYNCNCSIGHYGYCPHGKLK